MDVQTFQDPFDQAGQTMRAGIVERAWKDAAFRAQLMSRPTEVLSAECGVTVPPGFDLKVVEATSAYLPLVIPEPSGAQRDLSVREIEDQFGAAVRDAAPEVQTQVRSHARLLAQAWKDPVFLRGLHSDPRAVVQRELSVSIPAAIEVEVLADSPSVGHFVLPQSPAAHSDELSDSQLEMVAGGATLAVTLATPLFVMGGVAFFIWLQAQGQTPTESAGRHATLSPP